MGQDRLPACQTGKMRKRQPLLAIGLMSGTSVHSVDGALIERGLLLIPASAILDYKRNRLSELALQFRGMCARKEPAMHLVEFA